jgi:hypothetical protein
VLAVDGEVAAVLANQKRRRVVIVLLEMRMQHDVVDLGRAEIVDRDLDVAPSRIGDVGLVAADRADRPDDQLAVVDDHARVHEPRPRAVVVEAHQRRRDVVRRIVVGREDRRTHGQHDQPRTHENTKQVWSVHGATPNVKTVVER